MSRRPKRNTPKPALPYVKNMLAHTDDVNLLCMFWAIDAIQSGREKQAKRYLPHPEAAATDTLDSPFAVYKWDIETLIGLTLNTLKSNLPPQMRSPLNTHDFNKVADLVNALRSVEDDETELRINVSNILLEMHRISHRQFAWQRGWVRTIDIYRYLYLYGQGKCADYFKATYGVTVADFVGVAFGLYATLRNAPWSGYLTGMELVGIDEEAVKRTYAMISGEVWTLRRESRKLLEKFEANLQATLPVIYQPSYLRVKPVIYSAPLNKYIAPLPELIMLRATLGLYYDLSPGGAPLLNDANARFEEYARHSIKAHCPQFNPEPAFKYRYEKNTVDSPDILLKREDKIVAVFECKATKLTFQAQYGDDPIENARTGYDQIAKAIFQLWRFFSHVRRGIVDVPLATDAFGIVLTLEPWTQMGGGLRQRIIEEANELAAGKEITDEDKRRPVFCPIQDLEEILAVSNDDELLQTFHLAIEEQYGGWGLRQLRTKVGEDQPRKDVPFDLSEFLPWWKGVEERKEQRKRTDEAAAKAVPLTVPLSPT